MRSTGQQASDLEHAHGARAARQNIRSRAPWTTIQSTARTCITADLARLAGPAAVTMRDCSSGKRATLPIRGGWQSCQQSGRRHADHPVLLPPVSSLPDRDLGLAGASIAASARCRASLSRTSAQTGRPRGITPPTRPQDR